MSKEFIPNNLFFSSQSYSPLWMRYRFSGRSTKQLNGPLWQSRINCSLNFTSVTPLIYFSWTDVTEVTAHLSAFTVFKYLLIVFISGQDRNTKSQSCCLAHVSNTTEVNGTSSVSKANPLLSHGWNHGHRLFVPFFQGV